MVDKSQSEPPAEAAIKVRRSRRRIYQEPGEAGQPPAAASEPEPTLPVIAASGPRAGTQNANADGGPAPGRLAQGQRVIRRYLAWAAGAGLVPFPVLDTLALIALQALMIKELAGVWGVDYSAQRARALLGALLGGVGAVSLATGVWTSWLKALPVVGQSLGVATMPAAAAGCTYAVGMVFQRHFQSGGTLLDFRAQEQRAELRRQMAQAPRPGPEA